MGENRWFRSSLTQIKKALEQEGITLSTSTIGTKLHLLKYSPRFNEKSLEGSRHPDRDLQFCYIRKVAGVFSLKGLPIISVDTKNKELLGQFKNGGQSWCKDPISANIHDFPSQSLGRAVPYGIYDLNTNEGFVFTGNSADTPEFSVDCIKTWWCTFGCKAYPNANKLLILADSGGSNNCNYHLWKDQVQEKLANELGLKVTICHYPTGCSKWNPIEHRLFGPISVRWKGEPLETFEKMIALINSTTNKAGLKVRALLKDGVYKTGIKVSEAAIAALKIARHRICPKWNYTIRPARPKNLESYAAANIME